MARRLISKVTDRGFEQVESSTASDKAQLDDMLASRRPPQSLTDRELFAGMGNLASQFHNDDHMLNHVVAQARAHGYEPNQNDIYNSGLARFIGDPLAFIPPTSGRGHIKKVCELQNRSCEGIVNYTAPVIPEKEENIRLAPDLIAEQYRQDVAENPDLAHKPVNEVVEAIIDKHAPAL